MAKTKLRIAERGDIFLDTTRVENLFINEYLPDAPGDYVKVYLLALMYAKYEEEIDSSVMARMLGMEEFEVEEAWAYWEASGLVKRSKDGSSIEFIRMVERFYGKSALRSLQESPVTTEPELEEDDGTEDNFDDEEVDTFYDFDSTDSAETEPVKKAPRKKSAAEERLLVSEQLRQIFARFQEVTGRTISRRETDKLTDAINVYGVKPEVLFYAIDYCAELDKDSVDYIFNVALRWKEEGCENMEAVKALIEKDSERNKAYREIFKAVGFNRLTTPADREIMNRWFDEMDFSLDEVLEACKATGGIREPSLRYVNKILENKMLEKGGVKTDTPGSSSGGDAKVSRKVLREYFEHIRDEEERAYADRIREASSRIPGMAELLDRESELNRDAMNLMIGGSSEDRARMREERNNIAETKKSLLASEGYPADYLERRYRCNICKDSGYTDEGTVCTCCRARADEAYLWNLERDKN